MTREEAIKKLQKQKAEYLEEWVDYSGVTEALDMAIEALSADTVEVVRCKDCIHLYDVDGDHYECDFMDARYDKNGFCHHGERIEE